MATRICLVATPRSGSQYVSELLRGTITSINGDIMFNAQEPFSINPDFSLGLTPSGWLTLNYENKIQHTPATIVDSVLECLRNVVPEQSIIIRFFPFGYYGHQLDKIFTELKSYGFEFIVLKRDNLEEQLLSYGISETVKKWSNFKLTEPIKITNFRDIMGMRDFLFRFETITTERFECLKMASVIHYEHALAHVEEIFGVPADTSEVNSIQRRSSDPYEFIENKEIVKKFIEYLVNDPKYAIKKVKIRRIVEI
jgi:hypothetical protein